MCDRAPSSSNSRATNPRASSEPPVRTAISVAAVVAVIAIVTVASPSTTTRSVIAANPTSALYLPLVIKSGPTAIPTLNVLANQFTFIDIINYLHILGEVKNNTATNAQFVKVIADVYNGNQLVGNDYTYIWMNTLVPSAKSCFDVSQKNPQSWTNIVFEPVSYSAGGTTPPKLTLLNITASYNPSSGDYKIIGLVRNDNGTHISYAEVVGTLYNSAGKVVGCEFTYANSTSLTAGQSTSFTLNFFSRDYADVVSYVLQTDGSLQ